MPRRETRETIERALAEQRRKRRTLGGDGQARVLTRMVEEMTRLRKTMSPAEFARFEARFQRIVTKLTGEVRRRRRRPGEGSMPALVEPPRGPRPLSGGAAAALEFDD